MLQIPKLAKLDATLFNKKFQELSHNM